MKKVCFILGLSLLAAACSNNNQKTAIAKTNNQMEMKSDSAMAANPNAKTDPVCGMVEGKIPWTDFSVYQNDTVWFCSPHDKEQFDKNPAKYVKK